MKKKYKVVILDPGLKKLGHHIGFNKHVIKLLGIFCNLVILDIDNTLKDSINLNKNSTFVDLRKYEFAGAPHEQNVGSIDVIMKSRTACENLWKLIDSFSPDIVFLTSEGRWRKHIYEQIPKNKKYKVFVIVHVLWLFLKTLQNDRSVDNNVRNLVDGIFVIEPFLAIDILKYGFKSFYFPHRGYSSFKRSPLVKKKFDNLRIGSIGVINEKRNYGFLIDALSEATGDFEYRIAGEVAESVRIQVQNSINNYKNRRSGLYTKFGYLTEDEFDEQINSLDISILAYDDERNLQASGALYSYVENGIPCIVPDIALFRNYEAQYGSLIIFYNPLDKADLQLKVESLRSENFPSFVDKFNEARDNFFYQNNIDKQAEYIELVFDGLNNSLDNFLVNGNKFLRDKYVLLAEGMYIASISLNHKLVSPYQNLKYLYYKRRDFLSYNRISNIESVNRHCSEYWNGFSDSKLLNIMVYPSFSDKDDLYAFISRMSWYLNPVYEKIRNIYIIKSFTHSGGSAFPKYISNRAISLVKYFEPKIIYVDSFEKVDLENIDIFYTLDDNSSEVLKRASSSKNIKPVWRVNNSTERFASSFFLKSVSDYSHAESSRTKAKLALNDLKQRFTNNRCAVFGTGPSLSEAFNYSFSNIDTIASNSMVNNIELLDHINPKVIVCADPIFHAGESTYAEEFRSKLLNCLKRYECPLIVPERDAHIYHSYFDKHGVVSIPIPFKKTGLPNYNLGDDFWVEGTGNILTLFLLQIGFSFADVVEIYGCDGRPLNENKYFWKHDNSAQLVNKMDDIKLAHPAFFSIDYDEYYDIHCETVMKFLNVAEENKKVTISKTFSHIPALAERFNGENQCQQK